MVEAAGAEHESVAYERASEFIDALEEGTTRGKDDFVRIISRQSEPTSARNRQRREAFFSAPFSICIERARYFTESFRETEGELPLLRMAKAYRNYLAKVTVVLHDADLFAGYAGGKLLCSQVYPELRASCLDEDSWASLGDFDVNPVSISAQEIAELKEMADFWRGRSVQDFYMHLRPDDDINAHLHGLIFAHNMLAGIGHMIVDVQRVLKGGLKSIGRAAQDHIQRLQRQPEDGTTPKKAAFYQAVTIAIDGVVRYANRCGRHAETLAGKEADEKRRRELLRIADACRRVPEHPARNFFEAVQCTLLLLVVNQMESSEISVCPGRMDQFLYPIYRDDIANGKTTRTDALELLENFLIRLAQSSWLYYGSQAGPLVHPRRGNLVTVTLSGKDEKGTDLTNELTYLLLHAQANNALGFPNMAVRFHTGSPDRLWEACARVIGNGKGQPALMNDEVMVPALMRIGLESEDAFNYADIGCIEMGAAGTSIGPVSIGFVNLAKCLDLALNDGRCTLSGNPVGPETGDPRTFATYDQLFDAYREQVRFAVTQFNQSVSALEMAHENLRPIPFLSAITDDAMQLGLDLTDGGSKYYTAGIEGIGLADVADSLAAVKKLVFDDHVVAMAELCDGLSNDFAENEALRQMLLHKAPKYGNDDDDADEIARDCCSVFLKEVKNHTDYWGSTYYPGIWSIELAMSLGLTVGALPSGRRAGEALTEGVAPSRGCDRNGPTATVKSVSKLDHHLMENGSIFNIKFSPQVFTEDNLDKFTAVAKTYFEQGGFQMQVTVVGKQALLEAQRHPDKHRDLVVRISGYSGIFVNLSDIAQDEIISRTKYEIG